MLMIVNKRSKQWNGNVVSVLILFYLSALHTSLQVQAFAAVRSQPLSCQKNLPTSITFNPRRHFLIKRHVFQRFVKVRKDILLYQASYLEGSNGRGLAILTLALSICVWIFSIPPEIRREHICTTSGCVENRSKCYDCVTFDEWKGQIVKYYQNGGRVHFDLSVDPETLEFWSNLKK